MGETVIGDWHADPRVGGVSQGLPECSEMVTAHWHHPQRDMSILIGEFS